MPFFTTAFLYPDKNRQFLNPSLLIVSTYILSYWMGPNKSGIFWKGINQYSKSMKEKYFSMCNFVSWIQNSALASQGRILSNISFDFWAMQFEEKLLLRFTNLQYISLLSLLVLGPIICSSKRLVSSWFGLVASPS